jgi:transcriptional regulator NrdR family protein
MSLRIRIVEMIEHEDGPSLDIADRILDQVAGYIRYEAKYREFSSQDEYDAWQDVADKIEAGCL